MRKFTRLAITGHKTLKDRACLVLFFVCLVQALKAATPVASVLLSDPAVSNNLTHFTVTDPGNEPYTIQTTRNGIQCRQVPDKKYAYFNVDDATIPSMQNNLIFYITFLMKE